MLGKVHALPSAILQEVGALASDMKLFECRPHQACICENTAAQLIQEVTPLICSR